MDQSTFEDPSIAGRYYYESRVALAGHAFPPNELLVKVYQGVGKLSRAREPVRCLWESTNEREIAIFRAGVPMDYPEYIRWLGFMKEAKKDRPVPGSLSDRFPISFRVVSGGANHLSSSKDTE